MKANVKIKVESDKTCYYMLFPAIAWENNWKAYRSFTIGLQFLNRYVEMVFTSERPNKPTNQLWQKQ